MTDTDIKTLGRPRRTIEHKLARAVAASKPVQFNTEEAAQLLDKLGVFLAPDGSPILPPADPSKSPALTIAE